MTGPLATAQGLRARAVARPDGLADVLDELSGNLNRNSDLNGIRLGVLLNAVGRRSYGPLLLLLGLIAVSPLTIVPFMTSVVAAITLLLAAQMALGLKRPWLPKRVLEIRIPRRGFFVFLDKARPAAVRVDGTMLRQRWSFMTVPLFVNLVALCVCVAALVTFPLSLLPIAPLAPGLAIVMFGLGMTARDGVWLAIGMILTGAALAATFPVLL